MLSPSLLFIVITHQFLAANVVGVIVLFFNFEEIERALRFKFQFQEAAH